MSWLRGLRYWVIGQAGVNRLSRVLGPPLYRWTGGAGFLGNSLGNLTILLTTTGHRSGEPRTVNLWAYPDGDALVVVGSYGGKARAPGWVHNLRANPHATIQVHRETRAVVAHEARNAEYERLWTKVDDAYPGYAQYREWARRPIPLLVLSPAERAADQSSKTDDSL